MADKRTPIMTELPQWEGGRLFDMSAGFFYGNSCNSGTGTRKIIPKVGDEPSLRGLQMGHWPKLGSYGKNWIFWPKSEILGPKKRIHFLILTMFWPRPEKVFQRKKLPLPNNQGGKCHFGWFFGVRPIFRPKTGIFGPKKGIHFLPVTMFWPQPKKVVQRKKGPLPK